MEWISVKDRLPEKNKEVLGYNAEYNCFSNFMYCDYGGLGKDIWISDGENFEKQQDPDYWMPLPEPPEKEKGD